MIKVLFVCLGNICRSPMADAIFQQQVKEAGLGTKIMVDSAGTGSWHVGEKAHQGTRAVLKKNNIPYNGRARQLTQRDLSDFDYILAMDESNLANIQQMAGGESDGEIALFLDYANAAGLSHVKVVPDPYYDGRFNSVYELVETGSRALLDHIRKEHNL
ncbi:MAG: low molecular weight protein-tyrosine-phosphatase [Anaerolineae bacterium]|nr:low molecular weight protein-tyrosine-phosphatase [Anaerolineae bacterium]